MIKLPKNGVVLTNEMLKDMQEAEAVVLAEYREMADLSTPAFNVMINKLRESNEKIIAKHIAKQPSVE